MHTQHQLSMISSVVLSGLSSEWLSLSLSLLVSLLSPSSPICRVCIVSAGMHRGRGSEGRGEMGEEDQKENGINCGGGLASRNTADGRVSTPKCSGRNGTGSGL